MSESGIFLHRTTFANLPRFGGGGGGNTQTIQKSDPWGGQQPYLQDVMGQAQFLEQNEAPFYYPGSTYQPLTDQQWNAGNTLYGVGMQGGTAPLNAAGSFTGGALSPNYTAQTQGAFDQANPAIGSMAGGSLLSATSPAFSQGQGFLGRELGGGYLAPTANSFGENQRYLGGAVGGNYVAPTAGAFGQTQGMLSNEISGQYLDPTKNPGFSNVVNSTLAKVMPAISSPFTAAGRSDSGLASRALAEGATDAVGNLALQNYQAERGAQQAAGQQAQQGYLTERGLQSNAAQQAAQQYLAERGLQSGAAAQAAQNQGLTLGATQAAQGLASQNLLTQQGNQFKGAALAPGIDAQSMANYQTALGAAGLGQQNSQNLTNADIQKWNYEQMLPWNNLGLYNQLVQGNYGGTSTTTQPYYQNQGANALSGALGGAALGAGLAGTLGVSSGLGAGGGAALGALAAFL